MHARLQSGYRRHCRAHKPHVKVTEDASAARNDNYEARFVFAEDSASSPSKLPNALAALLRDRHRTEGARSSTASRSGMGACWTVGKGDLRGVALKTVLP